jgi:hypothetical protein
MHMRPPGSDDGTQITACKDGETIFIDSGGLGDFYSHSFDVTLLPESDNTDQ